MVDPLPPSQVSPSRAYACRILIAPEAERAARQQWESGATVDEVARSLGVSRNAFKDIKIVGCLRDWARRQGAGGGRPIGLRASSERGSVAVERNPSVREIRLRTEGFRATWSDEEMRLRREQVTDIPGWDLEIL